MPLEYKNCAKHVWPTQSYGRTARSIGTVEYEQCNNCLAYRITFSSDVMENGEWIKVQETQIIEPMFGVEQTALCMNCDGPAPITTRVCAKCYRNPATNACITCCEVVCDVSYPYICGPCFYGKAEG